MTNSPFTSMDRNELIDALVDVVACTMSPEESCPNSNDDVSSWRSNLHSTARDQRTLIASWNGRIIYTAIAANSEWYYPSPSNFWWNSSLHFSAAALAQSVYGPNLFEIIQQICKLLRCAISVSVSASA